MGKPLQGVRTVYAALLALALLWAQSLGYTHAVVHGLPHAGPTAVQAQQAEAPNLGWPDHDAGDAQCRLLDQLSHADSVPGVPWVFLPVVLSATPLLLQQGLAVARWAALFQARAPPSVP
ncbi:MAG: hypothetical protein CFE44_05695 [Burkholderiales bacterium PBB4]|nr:MAG: hypothetical protein CFE44_05695 [Burkholderiales bacterium PBB4]